MSTESDLQRLFYTSQLNLKENEVSNLSNSDLAALYYETRPNRTFVSQHETKLRKWYAVYGARESAQAQILVVGDSVTEGTGSADVSRRWQTLLQKQLRQRTGLLTGASFPFIPAIPQTPATGMPVSRTGTIGASGGFGLGLRAARIEATGSVTFTFTGTRAKVMYAKGTSAGVMSVSVDGGVATTLDTYDGTVLGGHVLDLGALASGDHTVVVTRDATSLAGRDVYLEGLLTYNGDESSGIRVVDGGKHGTQSSAFTSGTTHWNVSARNAGPFGLAIIGLGFNDSTNSVTRDTYKTNIQTIITNLRSTGTYGSSFDGSILLLHYYKRSEVDATLWSEYRAALTEIQDNDPDVLVLDIRSKMPDVPSPHTDAAGLGLYADSIHPSDRGYGYLSDLILNAVLPR